MARTSAEMLEQLISVAINAKYPDAPPSEEDFMMEANVFRQHASVTDKEFEQIIRNLKAALLIAMDIGVFISDPDDDHQSWLPRRRAEIDFFYWNRYKKYLEVRKGWNSRMTASLDKVSDEILDLLGDPQSGQPYQRRGLVLGDVQSGKTANYTAICNKAADTGYKVIIVLAGMMDNLRVQTQERLDTEFAGRKSKFLLSSKYNTEIKNVFDGVGKIDARKRISAFTTVTTDFNSIILNSNDMTLMNLRESALFVVKKNKKILSNLDSWLWSNNADASGKIDLPLLLIDDEADNASVNTKKEDENPTAINKAIRTILSRFSQASYLGITATPFANIFINPETNNEMLGDELFPRDFIYALSPPTNYIGPDAVFGDEARYESCLERISQAEMEGYFPFKHKKDIGVDELPSSMYEAMGYFALANAIRDIRGDTNEHRSMLMNVSRFTDVQSKIATIANEWLVRLRSDTRNYAALSENKAMQIQSLRFLRNVWDKHEMEAKAGICWIDLQQKYLYKAVAPIEVRAVNQRTGAASLDYYAHRENGFRVIAIGGNSLSRGLTLEGLCVSYFYRNSQMYDTLLQMGRWFGYRKNYEDVFKVWMASDAIDWYGYITSAANELKDEIGKMNRIKQSPRDFGLKVRQDPNSLIATARNKMRTATLVHRPISVQGRLLETPRLKSNLEILQSNEKIFRLFVANLDSIGTRVDIKHKSHFWTGIPKELVVDLLRTFNTHPWHLSFQGGVLAEYIQDSSQFDEWDVVIPNGSSEVPYVLYGAYDEIVVFRERRNITESQGMIKISRTKVRVGAGGCTKAGLTDVQIKEAEDEFRKIRNKQNVPDSAYLIKGRKPLLMLHVIESHSEDPQNPKIPETLFAIGIGLPLTDQEEKTANYIVNMVELRNWLDPDEGDDDNNAD